MKRGLFEPSPGKKVVLHLIWQLCISRIMMRTQSQKSRIIHQKSQINFVS